MHLKVQSLNEFPTKPDNNTLKQKAHLERKQWVGQNIQQSNLSVNLLVIWTWWSLDLLWLRTIQVFNLMWLWTGLSPPHFGGGVTNRNYGVYWVGFEILFKFIYWYKLLVKCVLTVKRLTIRRGLHLLNSSKVNIFFAWLGFVWLDIVEHVILSSVVSWSR